MAGNIPALPPGFELEGRPGASDVPALPEGFELESSQQAQQPKGMFAAGLSSAGRAVAALPGMIGDISETAKSGGRALGYTPPEHNMLDRLGKIVYGRKFPTSEETTSAAVKAMPSLGYQPQTPGEEYAATVGGFVPAALAAAEGNPSGIMRSVTQNAIIPGVTSEMAGQATKGTAAEQVARMVGALGGGVVAPSIMSAPGRVISPFRQSPRVGPAVETLEKAGVPLMADQKTGSNFLKLANSTAADITGQDLTLPQYEAMTNAATKTTGLPAPKIEPGSDWYSKSKDRFKDIYGGLTSRHELQMDPQFGKDIRKAYEHLVETVTPEKRPEMAFKRFRTIEDTIAQGGKMPGKAYQADRGVLESLSKGEDNPNIAKFWQMIRKSYDDAMGRSIKNKAVPGDWELWQKTNKEYANYKTLEKAMSRAGEAQAQGYVSPASLRNEVANWNKNAYLTGKSDLGNLAAAANATLKPYPSSGTAQRNMMISGLKTAGYGAGALAGATQSDEMGVDPITGAILGLGGSYAASRGLLSRPVQAWLANQNAQKLGLVLKPQSGGQRAIGLLAPAISSQYATIGR